jgi:hypothetical protein
VEDAGEVVQPDVRPVVQDELVEAVLLEREPDEVVDRVAEDRREDDDDRQDEQVRDGAAGESAASEPPPPRRGGRGGG